MLCKHYTNFSLPFHFPGLRPAIYYVSETEGQAGVVCQTLAWRAGISPRRTARPKYALNLCLKAPEGSNYTARPRYDYSVA